MKIELLIRKALNGKLYHTPLHTQRNRSYGFISVWNALETGRFFAGE